MGAARSLFWVRYLVAGSTSGVVDGAAEGCVTLALNLRVRSCTKCQSEGTSSCCHQNKQCHFSPPKGEFPKTWEGEHHGCDTLFIT